MKEITEVATIEPQREVAVYTRRAIDFKLGVQLLPVEEQQAFLEEHTKRRDHFRQWLLSQLVEGVHFGYPPGCEPKFDKQGRPLVDPKSWRQRPGLYQAGAQFIVELTHVLATFDADLDTWKMSGEVKGLIFRKCKLLNPSNGEVLGEGSGAFAIGKKNQDANGAVKMANKNSLVAAVIITFALGDLFTQDLEDQTSHTDESMDADFGKAVQEWVDELKIWPEYKVRKSEIMALRASLSIWVRGQIPNNAEAAMAWIRENVSPEIMHGKEGNATGLKFIIKRDADKTEKEATEEWDSARSTLREWYDKAVAAGKKNDFAAVIEKVCKKPMKELKTTEDFKTAIKAVAELEAEWQQENDCEQDAF